MKRTKIIATIGPASKDVVTLTQMIKAGMNVARLNFSHGTYASHVAIIKNIRSAALNCKAHIGIMQDLSGPKLRLGEFKERQLKQGERVVLGYGGVPVMRHIWEWVKPGQSILIDDGLVELIATKVHEDCLETKVIFAGPIKSHKGVNLPGIKVDLPALSEKDLQDLEFGLKSGVDFVAQSFVRTANDIQSLKSKIKNFGGKAAVIAKIETAEALKNIDKIIAVSDAVMVARGDLALNIAQELMPIAQKNIIKKCLKAGKPVIIATQMLDSMIHSPRPTRAEILDVANAVIDHVDAVMLSGESAFGQYPVKTVETMAKIIDGTEESPLDDFYHPEKSYKNLKEKDLVLAHNLLHVGRQAHAKVIVVSRLALAMQLSRFRSEEEQILLASRDESELRKSSLVWGVAPLVLKGNLQSILKHQGLIAPSERYLDATSLKLSATIHSIH